MGPSSNPLSAAGGREGSPDERLEVDGMPLSFEEAGGFADRFRSDRQDGDPSTKSREGVLPTLSEGGRTLGGQSLQFKDVEFCSSELLSPERPQKVLRRGGSCRIARRIGVSRAFIAGLRPTAAGGDPAVLGPRRRRGFPRRRGSRPRSPAARAVERTVR